MGTPRLVQRAIARIGYARSERDSGFTLIEAVVSLVLFAIVATASVVAVADSTKSSVRTRDRVAATNLAQQDLAQLRALANRTTIASATKSTTVGGRAYTVKRTVTGACPAVSTLTSTSKITVSTNVTWANTTGGGVTLATVLAC